MDYILFLNSSWAGLKSLLLLHSLVNMSPLLKTLKSEKRGGGVDLLGY